ncbi:hypothetical protein RRG08_064358 [Elysia crispata]|uniref:DRBM domain-containing protein n=1 Tax=Elysia crispata TaxID=231223 RepID=A0AAE0XTJ4_9GAST|nr:hypothetical protein RRG08_064358 [Elysia crispata]
MAGLDSLGAKRSMGIQFVKSSNNDDMQSFFNNTVPSAKCSESSSRGSVKSAPFQFGGPAKQFDSYRDKVQPMQRFVRPGEGYKSYNGGNSQPAWRENGSLVSGSNSKGSFSQQQTFPRTPTAKFVLSPQEYQKLWRQEKDPSLVKIRKLAWEVANLKSDRPNAIYKLHSASNRVPARIEFNTEPVFGSRGNNSFRCHVFVESILIGSGQGIKIKDSKVNAYEAALQKILMPELRVNRLDFESRELEGFKEPFTSPPPEPSNTILPKSSAQFPPSYKEDGKPRQRDKKIISLNIKSPTWRQLLSKGGLMSNDLWRIL